MSDFFDTHTGNAESLDPRRLWRYRLRDRLLTLDLHVGRALSRIRRSQRSYRARVLIVGVEVPARAADLHRVMGLLQRGSRHVIDVAIAPMENRGKFANIDAAIQLAPHPLAHYDWLVVTDDDIAFATSFLDDLIGVARSADLAISQPAHAIESHTTYAITKRRRGSIARRTNFVEIGPLTLLRADTFAALIPFPESRWCYGIDVLWSEIAKRNGYRMGIVDGTPIRHLRPVAASYDMDDAIAEGRELLRRFDVRRNRDELFARNDVVVPSH